ncbi:hypothetical protein [Sphingomicrobium arenosum]|uniref:hypothetical protein n=1 Tax=Sphingomicrobium arenosum TaxID=2233861 RepID=UPI00223F6788|nr:hypothetical protein [Sphingomicrobium arenosum]
MSHQQRLLLGLLIVFAGWVLSNHATAVLFPLVHGQSCAVEFLGTRCDLAPDRVQPPNRHALLGLLVLGTMIGLRLFARTRVVYPFAMIFGTLCLFTIGYDALARQPIINSVKIVNDTINILGAVIAASFALLLVILRRHGWPLGALVRAVVASYAIKVASVAMFLSVMGAVHGATELFLLYIFYAFGAFSLHLMTISDFIARTAVPPQEAVT